MHGLPNLGNTCYLNSVVQMMVSLKLLTYPPDMKQFILSLNFPNVFSQNDQHEFLIFLLNKIQNITSIKVKLKSITSHNSEHVSNIEAKLWKKANNNLYQYGYSKDNKKSSALFLSHASKFIGQRIYKKKCDNPACGNIKITFDTFSTLELALQDLSNITIDQLLKNDYNENYKCTLTCKKCGCLTATGYTRIWKKPKILCITFMRYSTPNGKKNNIKIDFPLELDVSDYSVFNQKQPYSLVGILYHHGPMINHGHCTYSYYYNGDGTDTSQGTGKWYNFDDNIITETNGINTSDAYILIYSK